MESVSNRDKMMNILLLSAAALMMLLVMVVFPLRFGEDVGNEYRRTYEVTWNRLNVVQYALDSDYKFVADHCAIWPLRLLALLAAAACAYAALCRDAIRLTLLVLISFALTALYYAVLVGYVLYLSDEMVATVYFRWSIPAPAVSMGVLHYIHSHFGPRADDDDEED